MEDVGIDKIQKILRRLGDFLSTIAEANEDKKFTFIEVTKISLSGAQLGWCFKSWQELKTEYEDLNESEKLQLLSEFKTEFDLPNDKAENAVEKIIEVLVASDQIIKIFTKNGLQGS
jgi:hypothetical protein